jgi:pimeloyl-ACP methyl ester carboxylesterase
MRLSLSATFAAIFSLAASAVLAAPPADLPPAIYTDPAPDSVHPARMEVLHIPSHGLLLNGIAYVAAGAGGHPVVVLLHGLPGNEKNLDLAQAIRRAGWTVVTFNYRGSWGTPGVFRFAQNLEDADAALAFVRDPANAKSLGLDARRVVIIGHSMGGWVAINTAARDKDLIGLVSISAADMTRLAGAPEPIREKVMAGNMESLAGVTARSMAADVATLGPQYALPSGAEGLVGKPYLALTADDGLAGDTDALVNAIRARGGRQVSTLHIATDHTWDDRRIALEAAVIGWLQALK